MKTSWCLLVLAGFAALILGTSGHGRLMEPPSRGSMWRQGFDSPVDYGDNQLFCGGFKHHWEDQGGKCGVCGDPYDGPRDHEPGGKYYSGIITRSYKESQVIDVQVELTAFHFGWFEFRLCPLDHRNQTVGQECFDRHKLKVETESDSGKSTRYKLPRDTSLRFVNLKVKLPQRVICEQCVLQWKYHAANSWGKDPDGKACVGCGHQEEFFGCSDIAITGENSAIPNTWDRAEINKIPDKKPKDKFNAYKMDPRLVNILEIKKAFAENAIRKQNDWYGSRNVASQLYKAPTAKKAPAAYSSASTNTGGPKGHCRAAGAWKGQQGMTDWCIINCERGFCPKTHCSCEKEISFNAPGGNSAYFGQKKVTGLERYSSGHVNPYRRGSVPANRPVKNRQPFYVQYPNGLPSYRPHRYPEGRSVFKLPSKDDIFLMGYRRDFKVNPKWEVRGLRKHSGQDFERRPWVYDKIEPRQIDTYTQPRERSFIMDNYQKSLARLFPEFQKKIPRPAYYPSYARNNTYSNANTNVKAGGFDLQPNHLRQAQRFIPRPTDINSMGTMGQYNDVPGGRAADPSNIKGSDGSNREKQKAEETTKPISNLHEREDWLLNTDEDIFAKLNEDKALIAKARFVEDNPVKYKVPMGRELDLKGGVNAPTKRVKKCKAGGSWAGQAPMDAWCQENCAIENCPKTHCSCA